MDANHNRDPKEKLHISILEVIISQYIRV